jgi:tetratricopeptide (TPR) repeat protein
MRVLMLTNQIGRSEAHCGAFVSARGHEMRTLCADGPADYAFSPSETASEVLDRVGKEWQPDALVCWNPELFPPPREVERCLVKTAAVISDWNIYHAQLEWNLARYDVVLSDKLGAQRLQLQGATPRYLFPLYSQCSLLHRKLDIPKDIDVVFVGSPHHGVHPKRGRLLERIASLSDRYRVVITSGRFDEDYTRMLNRARIVFNHALRREMNLRCFETLACGSLLFLEEDNLEAGDYLNNRESVVFYREENLLELIEHYLANPDEADRIASQGHALAPSLAIENRLDVLFDWLEQQPAWERSFASFSEEERALATTMQYATSLVSGQRDLAGECLGGALEQHPGRPGLVAAHCCYLMDQLAELPPDARKEATRELVQRMQDAANQVPDAAPLWLNLALVCRLANARHAETACLEQTLSAKSSACAGFLIGSVDDPFYSEWRRAMAVGEARVEHLWAQAATRLAQLRLEDGEARLALELADQACLWASGMALPRLMAGLAAERIGDLDKALHHLEAGLPLTAFDSDYRLTFVRVLDAAGRQADARELASASALIFAACPETAEMARQFRELAGSEA